MQQGLGLEVRWLSPGEFDELNPAVAPGRTLGSSYAPGDGYPADTAHQRYLREYDTRRVR